MLIVAIIFEEGRVSELFCKAWINTHRAHIHQLQETIVCESWQKPIIVQHFRFAIILIITEV
jgi:hypothetical protein